MLKAPSLGPPLAPLKLRGGVQGERGSRVGPWDELSIQTTDDFLDVTTQVRHHDIVHYEYMALANKIFVLREAMLFCFEPRRFMCPAGYADIC